MYCFIIYIILQLVIENLLSSGENMAKKSFYKIEMLFLKILEKEDCYGYQLTQSIQWRKSWIILYGRKRGNINIEGIKVNKGGIW